MLMKPMDKFPSVHRTNFLEEFVHFQVGHPIDNQLRQQFQLVGTLPVKFKRMDFFPGFTIRFFIMPVNFYHATRFGPHIRSLF